MATNPINAIPVEYNTECRLPIKASTCAISEDGHFIAFGSAAGPVLLHQRTGTHSSRYPLRTVSDREKLGSNEYRENLGANDYRKKLESLEYRDGVFFQPSYHADLPEISIVNDFSKTEATNAFVATLVSIRNAEDILRQKNYLRHVRHLCSWGNTSGNKHMVAYSSGFSTWIVDVAEESAVCSCSGKPADSSSKVLNENPVSLRENFVSLRSRENSVSLKSSESMRSSRNPLTLRSSESLSLSDNPISSRLSESHHFSRENPVNVSPKHAFGSRASPPIGSHEARGLRNPAEPSFRGSSYSTVMRLNSSAGHITDVTWCPNSRYVLATSTKDGMIQIWDIRMPTKQPAHTCICIGVPHIIRWNRGNGEQLAGAESNFVQLWDMRNLSIRTCTPLLDGPIVDLDWSYQSSDVFLTLVGSSSFRMVSQRDGPPRNASSDATRCALSNGASLYETNAYLLIWDSKQIHKNFCSLSLSNILPTAACFTPQINGILVAGIIPGNDAVVPNRALPVQQGRGAQEGFQPSFVSTVSLYSMNNLEDVRMCHTFYPDVSDVINTLHCSTAILPEMDENFAEPNNSSMNGKQTIHSQRSITNGEWQLTCWSSSTSVLRGWKLKSSSLSHSLIPKILPVCKKDALSNEVLQKLLVKWNSNIRNALLSHSVQLRHLQHVADTIVSESGDPLGVLNKHSAANNLSTVSIVDKGEPIGETLNNYLQVKICFPYIPRTKPQEIKKLEGSHDFVQPVPGANNDSLTIQITLFVTANVTQLEKLQPNRLQSNLVLPSTSDPIVSFATYNESSDGAVRVDFKWGPPYHLSEHGPLESCVLANLFNFRFTSLIEEGSEIVKNSVQRLLDILGRRTVGFLLGTSLGEVESFVGLSEQMDPITLENKRALLQPFPITSGVIWSPKGVLLHFHSFLGVDNLWRAFQQSKGQADALSLSNSSSSLTTKDERKLNFKDFQEIEKHRQHNLSFSIKLYEGRLIFEADLLLSDNSIPVRTAPSERLSILVSDKGSWEGDSIRFRLKTSVFLRHPFTNTPFFVEPDLVLALQLTIHGFDFINICQKNKVTCFQLNNGYSAQAWDILAIIFQFIEFSSNSTRTNPILENNLRCLDRNLTHERLLRSRIDNPIQFLDNSFKLMNFLSCLLHSLLQLLINAKDTLVAAFILIVMLRYCSYHSFGKGVCEAFSSNGSNINVGQGASQSMNTKPLQSGKFLVLVRFRLFQLLLVSLNKMNAIFNCNMDSNDNACKSVLNNVLEVIEVKWQAFHRCQQFVKSQLLLKLARYLISSFESEHMELERLNKSGKNRICNLRTNIVVTPNFSNAEASSNNSQCLSSEDNSSVSIRLPIFPDYSHGPKIANMPNNSMPFKSSSNSILKNNPKASIASSCLAIKESPQLKSENKVFTKTCQEMHLPIQTELSMKCGVCRLSVLGLCVFCQLCGHGGHPNHLVLWFRKTSGICATNGCGCHCILANVSC